MARPQITPEDLEFLQAQETLDKVNYQIEIYRKEIIAVIETLRNKLDTEIPFDLESLSELAENRTAILALQTEVNTSILTNKSNNESIINKLIDLRIKLKNSRQITASRRRISERRQTENQRR